MLIVKSYSVCLVNTPSGVSSFFESSWWLTHCPGVNTAHSVRFSSVTESWFHVQLFAKPWTAACQASMSITDSWSLLKLMSIESVMLSNHLILCFPLLLPPSIFPSIRVFTNESVLCTRWPEYWSFSFSISLPMNIQDWFPLGWTGWIS